MKQRTQRKKILSILLAAALVVQPGSMLMGGNRAKAADSLSDPVIKDGKVTWDTVYFGKYWQNDTNKDGKANQEDEKEPIRWRVLFANEEEAFLLADQNLDEQPYNKDKTDVTWKDCTLRTWLNQEFLKEAFTEEEQKAILETVVKNEKNPQYDIPGGEDTEDKVYLLSIGEVTHLACGFDTEFNEKSNTRVSKNTQYAIARASYSDTWWLRSPGAYSRSASKVNGYGKGDYYGENVNYGSNMVRPALKLSLSSPLLWEKGETVSATLKEGEAGTAEHGFSEWKDAGNGSHSRTCAVCKKAETAEHAFSEWTDAGDGSHSRTCAVCKKAETAEHAFSEWTDAGNGSHSRTCTDCKKAETAKHTFSEWKDAGDGSHSRTCTDCKKAEAAKHAFSEWTDAGNGSHSRTCTDCKKPETAKHAFSEWTDAGDGSHSRTCAVCKKPETAKHAFGEWKDAGNGSHSRTCTDCGKTETAEHGFSGWTDAGNGSHSRTCTDCKKTETAKHTFSEWKEEGNGISSRTCAVCNKTEKKEQAAEAPTFSLASGTYTENKSVVLTSSTDGAEIYYTIDGTEPGVGSKKYTSPISVTGKPGESISTTIKAIAVKSDRKNSSVATAAYIIKIPSNTEKTPGTESEKTPGTESEKTPGTESGKTPGTESGKTPGTESEKTPGTESEKTPSTESEKTPGTESEKTQSTEPAVQEPGKAVIRTLKLQVKKAAKNAIRISWSKAEGADGYLIYGNQCGNDNEKKLLQSVGKDTSEWKHSKLKKGTYYKYYIVAYQEVKGEKIPVSVSHTIHIPTLGGKFTDIKGVRTNKTKITLKKGKTFKIKASEIKKTASKKINRHVKIQFESSNKEIAAVSKSGKIKAVKKGACFVYVYAQNGTYKKLTVKVK